MEKINLNKFKESKLDNLETIKGGLVEQKTKWESSDGSSGKDTKDGNTIIYH